MVRLKSYVCGAWHEGHAPFRPLVNPATEEVVAETSARGIDFAAVLDHARAGGERLRAMTFAERGVLLKAMSKALFARREALIDVAQINGGNTRGDAKFDIDGATATLAFYANLGKGLGDVTVLTDGESSQLLPTSGRFFGKHIRVSRRGVAVHINAFNFPAWGTFEKVAAALLAGVPVITKPATSTAWLTYEMVRLLVDEEVLPEGTMQMVCGSTGDLLERLGGQDVLAFTGSAVTGARLRGGDFHVQRSAHVNVEADSLNASVLGPDIDRGSDTWNWFVRSVRLEMTQKAGQKCTAIRRVLIPEGQVDNFVEDLSDQLSRVKVGDPRTDGVTMGPLSNADQLQDYREGVAQLATQARIVYGSATEVTANRSIEGKGYFASPVVLVANDSENASYVHQREVFGPVTTVLPYDGSVEQAARLIALGGGSLASSLATDDRKFLGALALEMAPFNGRLLLVDKKVSDQATPHGMVMPGLVHGGPGRAGGGEELGGLRGLAPYMQRVALQGNRALLDKLF